MKAHLSNQVLLDFAPPYINGSLHLGHLYEFSLWYVLYNTVDLRSVLKHYSEVPFLVNYLETRPTYNLTATLGLDVNGLPISRQAEKRVLQRTSNTPTTKALFQQCDKVIQEYETSVKETFKKLGLYQLRDVIEYKTNDRFFKNRIESFLKSTPQMKTCYMPQFYCPKCQTVLSNSEVQKVLEDARSYYFNITCEGNSYSIMTTRPEFLPGIVAVVCNPSDSRYNTLIGKEAVIELPLGLKKVPIYGSQRVHINVGTGLVYITLWSNHLDLQLARDLKVQGATLYDIEGKVNQDIGLLTEDYSGIFHTQWFKKTFTIGEVRNLVKFLRHTQRSDCKSEVRLVAREEVVIDVSDESRRSLKSLIENLQIIPGNSKLYLLNNLESLRNWCISRGSKYYSFDASFENREFKVDTWLGSSMTAQLGDLLTENYEIWRLQGAEILRTWALYSLYVHMLTAKKGKFTKLVTHRHLLDEEGIKISKSRKNGPNVQRLLKTYSMGSLRYYFCQKPLQRDFIFKQKELKDVDLFFRKYSNLRLKIQSFQKENLDLQKYYSEQLYEEPNFYSKRYNLSFRDLVNRFKWYITSEAKDFKFSEMFSYLKFLVYNVSSRIQKNEGVFIESLFSKALLNQMVLLLDGFFSSIGVNLQKA